MRKIKKGKDTYIIINKCGVSIKVKYDKLVWKSVKEMEKDLKETEKRYGHVSMHLPS